jgi:hypothetical protein
MDKKWRLSPDILICPDYFLLCRHPRQTRPFHRLLIRQWRQPLRQRCPRRRYLALRGRRKKFHNELLLHCE